MNKFLKIIKTAEERILFLTERRGFYPHADILITENKKFILLCREAIAEEVESMR